MFILKLSGIQIIFRPKKSNDKTEKKQKKGKQRFKGKPYEYAIYIQIYNALFFLHKSLCIYVTQGMFQKRRKEVRYTIKFYKYHDFLN